MSNDINEIIEQLERLIRRDPANRGLIAGEEAHGPLCAGHLGAAAFHLAEHATHVGLVTGFYVPHGQPPAAETDGPPGTLMLARALESLGIEVTVLTDELCFPAVSAAAAATGFDAEARGHIADQMRGNGVDLHVGTDVSAMEQTADGIAVTATTGHDGTYDVVMYATGRVPNTENLGLESVGVQTNDRGQIIVDGRLATTAPNVYAIGDVVPGPMLAHKAEEEGIACVETIVTGTGHVNYDAIPNVVYTHPEIASVGKTEEELLESGTDFKKGVFHFAANGRAQAIAQAKGKVKVLADTRTDRVLGVHIVGPHAGDLIAEVAVAVEFSASSEDIARCVHAHPTLAEAIKEAALDANQRVIHS